MRKRTVCVCVAALVTLGSGVVNLLSVIGPSLPERRRLLKESFPLEFIHLSRFFTLLIGFALVISSINIYKRKKRAYRLVLLLAVSSVVFHLTKGLDYEEAIFSLVLVFVLLLGRKAFTVKSGVPNFRSALLRAAIAAGVALCYGVFGFWLLDSREFGINFTIADSVRRTLLFISLAGDPQITPYTRYAQWFINSLYLMTASAIGYSIFALFRPALYQLERLPHERARTAEILARHGRSALDYFKLWPDKSYFFSPSGRAFIAYATTNHTVIALGDPVGPEDEIEEIVRAFKAFCDQHGWTVAFHQTLPDFLAIYRRAGFKKLKIGDDAIVDLNRFSLEGKSMKKIRHCVNHLEKSGCRMVEHHPPIEKYILLELKAVSDEWLKIPGRRERRFTLGAFDAGYIRSTPVVAVEDKNGCVLAFVNIIPSCRAGEATIDLMRYRTDAPAGVMDFLFVKLFQLSRARGYERFNLGMAPMSGFQEDEEAALEERAVHRFFRRLNFIFNFSGLRRYKAKFATIWEPRYLIYRSALDLPGLAIALGRVSQFKAEPELDAGVAA
ncbi:MAG TPA: phosphatidylglycerol lysyltransferase domain-containing protein [Blastocatellia bacterium]|nr:phosphatidylglycerol lysyltransferase domain-containing protein [Blastocatellia bacterium]